MTVTTASTSVTLDVTVEVPIEKAFRVFTENFDQIKPREHNLLEVPIEATVFEPRVGGHIYDRGIDGSECRVGAGPRVRRPRSRRVQLGHQPAVAAGDRPRAGQ
jgi:hypothetical protein